VSAYTDAIKAAAGAGSSQKSKDAVKPVLISLHSNMSAAQLRLEEWASAAESASAALELDPSNSKALFRRGTARSKMGMLASAKDDLMAACRADPKDRNARTELASVTAALKAQKEDERSTFASKFGAATEKAVAKEEAKEAARKREEAKAKERAEAVLRDEWKAECRRLLDEQRAQREVARKARLRKFLGEATDVCDDAASTPGAPASASATDARDVSAWACAELRERLGAVAFEDDDVSVALAETVGVSELSGWASLTPTARGNMAHYAFSFGLKWRVTGREDGRTLGTGTLKYADVASPADGEGAPVIGDVDETTDASDGQVDPATPPGRVEADASRLAAAPGLLKAAVETTLSEFSDALEVHAPKTSGAGGGTDGADSADGAAPAAEPEGPPPITFEQYKSNKEKAEKEAKEAQEAKEKAAKDAADAERRRTRKEEKLRADDADLAGMRGYKVRADGSKTSYFTREVRTNG
jgi:hypothetical protein